MKLGIITSLWAYAEKLSVVDTLDRIAGLGLRDVDILGILHGHPSILDGNDRREIQESLDAHQLDLGSVILLPPGNIASSDESEIDICLAYVREGIELSAELGGKQVLINGGKRAVDQSIEQSWDNAAAFLSQSADYAMDFGIDITLEAEPYVYFLVNDFQSTVAMIEQVGHPNLLAVIDTGHMNLSRDPIGRIREFSAKIGRIHFSENDGVLHTNDILGTGTVPYREILPVLAGDLFDSSHEVHGYEICAVMELGVLGDPIEDPDEWARRSIDFIVNLSPEMKTKGGPGDHNSSR